MLAGERLAAGLILAADDSGRAEGPTRLTYELEVIGAEVKLTLTHETDRPDSKMIDAVSGGWPGLLASVKSLLETGKPLASTTKWPKDL